MSTFHRNLLIVANAGSGKTHRLVTRCIQLLRRGAEPKQILALTFTRAAAAEFLQKLFARLASAAEDADELRKLQEELADSPPMDAAGCTVLMRRLVEALPRLSMGTLDQYFGRVVRAFPFELGLAREMELLDEAEVEESRARALEQLFVQAKAAGLGGFINLLHQQNRNRAEQSALRGISHAVVALQEKFLETPPSARWGDARAIWPGGCANLDAGDVAAAAKAFRDAVAATNSQLGKDAIAAIERWLEAAVAHRPPRRMDAELTKFFNKLTDAGLGRGNQATPYIPIGGRGEARSLFLHDPMREARDNLRRAILKSELQSLLNSSQAIYDMLERYEGIYNQSVRQAGFLTFHDLVLLLAVNQEGISHQHIEYRLDGSHDHWLLDEFQDTSRLQWRVMEPLAQEVICDSGEQRSFFYVGDAKQAIYGWRGGDFELFQQVRDKFNGSTGDHIGREDLPCSYRSDRSIVEVVNRIFAPARLRDPANADFKLPDEMVSHWEKAWVDHKSLAAAREGFAQFKILTPSDEDEEDGQVVLDRAVLEILEETDPIGRGMNCAIIVRTRKMVDHYVALLRGQKIPIPAVAQGRVNPCLNSLEGAALFSLAKFLASPADTVARGHFLASPFGFLADGNPARFHLAALQSLAANGFAASFADWVRKASAKSLVNESNAVAFIEAASDYDTKGAAGADLLRFVRFIGHRLRQESETAGVVRVMTVHFSKGLGMDMVILPELGGKGLAELHDTSGMAVHRDKTGGIQWGLSLPSERVCAEDETLSDAREHLRARQAYENSCVLYVAMTRAKHALYGLHVRGRDFKNSGLWLGKNFPVTNENDPSIRSLGNRRWFEDFTFREAGGREIAGVAIKGSEAAARAIAPSFREGADVSAELLLAGDSARSLGAEVHEILARIEWLGGDSPDFTDASGQAGQLVRGFLDGGGASIFARPDGAVMLWRERAFDVEIDGHPVSGIFDRVHINLGADGRPVGACVYDFKTSGSTEDLNKKHGGQLETYRKAVALLLGLDASRVRAELGVIRMCA